MPEHWPSIQGSEGPFVVANLSTLYLNRKTIEQINLPMRKIIQVVEDALTEKAHGRVQMPAKHWMERDADRWFGGMSSLVPKIGYTAMKWQSGSAENHKLGLPYITGMLFLNSLQQGTVAAVMDSTWITQQRTAAASAVAIKYLARQNASSYAMLGAGVQGFSHFEALRLVMPQLAEVVIYDIDPNAAERFAAHVGAEGFRPYVVKSAREAVDATDIVITSGPIEPDTVRTIDADWLHAGMTAVAIDYDCYFKPAALHAANRLLTDDFGQVEHIKEYGYFVGCPKPEDELGSVVAGLVRGRTDDDEKIVVMNMGVAVEDVAVAKEIYEFAKNKGLGLQLEM
jgi:ornithine cyclodeaminase/alanine dehydrogenase-like protein (mu-crystallin family)